MNTAFGQNTWIGTAEESTFGTYVAPTKFHEIVKETLKGEHSLISKPTLRSVSQNARIPSRKSVAGGIEMQLGWSGFERFLKHGLGALNTSGGGPYTHDFTLTQNLPTGLSIHVNRDADNLGAGTAWKYEGCQIQKLTLANNIEEPITLNAEILGRSWDNLNVATPSFPAFAAITWDQMITFELDGYAVQAKTWELAIENNLAADRYILGNLLRKGLGRNGPRKVSGKFTLELDDLTAYNYFKNLSEAPLVIEYQSGTNFLQLALPKIILNGSDPSSESPGPLMLELSFEAWQSAAPHDELTIQINNDTAAP